MANNLVLAKAKNAITAHDWQTAARLYKELLRSENNNLDYLKELGSIYTRAGEDEKAIPYYEQIITFEPKATDAMISLGAIYRRLKRFEDSINILQRALDDGHARATVNYNLGFTFKDMGNYEDAIDAFESVISEKTDDVLAYNHLGSIYLIQKKYDKSIAAFKRGLQVDPNHPILNYNLARCYEAAKNYPEAVRCFENALKTRPGWTDAIRDFSVLLIKCQQTRQAQELVEQSIKLHPNDVDLLCILGRIYLNQFDYDNATKTFKKAKSINENDIKILIGLAEALEKNDKLEQAMESIIEAMDIAPQNKEVRKQYIHTLLSLQRYDKALEALNVLNEETEEKDLQVLDLYGQYFVCRGDDEAANTYYEKIKKINHHYKDYMLNAADRYLQTGNYGKAEEFANEFIERRPQLPDGYNRLGIVHKKKGFIQQAKIDYEKGLACGNPNVFGKKELQKINEELEQNGSAIIDSEEVLPQDEVPPAVDEAIATPDELMEGLETEEEAFDYTQLGDNVPMGEALVEEEDDFWEDFDDDPDRVAESLVDEDDVDDEEQADRTPFETMTPIQSKAGEEDSEELAAEEPDEEELSAENLSAEEPATEEPDEEDPFAQVLDSEAETAEGEDEVFDFSQFDEGSAEETPEEKLIEPESDPEPIVEPVVEQVAPAAVSTDTAREARNAMNTAGNALDAAVMAQKMAQRLEEKQEQQIQNAVEKAIEETIVDEAITEEVVPENTVPDDIEGMIKKIERILSDDKMAAEYADQIDLFKTLRTLAAYLPESEKDSFLTCRMCILMEYLIAKMSGKPGLLATTESLIKSGVLGEEYAQQLNVEKEDYLSNELVSQGLQIMKKLAEGLEDQNLVHAMSVSIDGILEKIELENQKSQIF